MSLEQEQSVSDVEVESSATPESTSPEPAAAAPSEAPKQEQYVPYERFKELVEQKNEFSKRFEATDKELKEFRSRFEKQEQAAKGPSEEQKLIDRLKGVDPEFGKWAEQQEARNARLHALEESNKASEARYQQQQAEATRNQAVSTLEKLQGEHKVDKTIHELYVARIREMAQANPNLGLQDLPGIYKGLHDGMSKFLETQNRSKLTEYSTSKKTDSKVPSQAKGTSTKPATKQTAKTPEEMRANLRSEMVAAMRKAKEI